MTIRNSVETARASVSNIESYISKKWPGFFDEIATTLSKPLWRMGKNDMFAICDQDIDDINRSSSCNTRTRDPAHFAFEQTLHAQEEHGTAYLQ